MRKFAAALAFIILCVSGCNTEIGSSVNSVSTENSSGAENEPVIPPETTAEEVIGLVASEPYTRDTLISDEINDPVFGDYGRLIFPVDEG